MLNFLALGYISFLGPNFLGMMGLMLVLVRMCVTWPYYYFSGYLVVTPRHLVVTARYLVVNARYRSFLLIPTFSMKGRRFVPHSEYNFLEIY